MTSPCTPPAPRLWCILETPACRSDMEGQICRLNGEGRVMIYDELCCFCTVQCSTIMSQHFEEDVVDEVQKTEDGEMDE